MPRRQVSSCSTPSYRPRLSGTTRARSTYQPNEKMLERMDYHVNLQEKSGDEFGNIGPLDDEYEYPECDSLRPPAPQPSNMHPEHHSMPGDGQSVCEGTLVSMFQQQQAELRKILTKQEELAKTLEENNKRVKVLEESMKKVNEMAQSSSSTSTSERKRRVITKDLTVSLHSTLMNNI